MRQTIFIVFSLASITLAAWSSENLPNPTRVDLRFGHAACRMSTPSLLCDPDAALTEQQRVALNHQLLLFQNATADPSADSECKRKGTTAAIAILNNVDAEIMNQQNMSMLAVFAHSRWVPDPECHKSFVIVLPTRNWRLISRDYHYEAPIFYDEFTFYFFREHEAFERGEFFAALTNIVVGLQNAVNLKRQLVGHRLIAEALDEYVAKAPEDYRQLTITRLAAKRHLPSVISLVKTALALLRDPSFLLAVLAIAVITYAFFKLLEIAGSRIWPRWTKTRVYHPVELSSSRLALPLSKNKATGTCKTSTFVNVCQRDLPLPTANHKTNVNRVSMSTFTTTSPAPSPPPSSVVP